MKVRMKVQITGTRDGSYWPAAGKEITLPDHEGAKLCGNGSAEPVVSDDPERADCPKPQKRATPQKRGQKRAGPVAG